MVTSEKETQRLTFPVEGMTCAACVYHVESALKGVPGVRGVAVSLGTERASVDFVPGLASFDDMQRAVEQAGVPGR